tara:strand:+ start:2555 stop:3382 length:828 start_codon:yes stop_codon:yes gene_type:complete
MFKPLNTQDHTTSYRKCLLYGSHGWGKTTQFRHYQDYYGEGFIISGESGLSSIRSAGIDYLPFTSWDGGTDPALNEYSFKDIFKWMRTPDFKSKNYKWIGIDSLTELSNYSKQHAEATAEADAKKKGKPANNFEAWANHAAQLVGACKAIRDMPMHVMVTALAKENSDDNGNTEYWPMIDGKASMQQLPGIFDCVFAGIRSTSGNKADGQKVVRYIVTDEVRGWKGKVRDEKRRLRPWEQTGSVVDLFKRMDMSDADFAKLKESETETSEEQENQ